MGLSRWGMLADIIPDESKHCQSFTHTITHVGILSQIRVEYSDIIDLLWKL